MKNAEVMNVFYGIKNLQKCSFDERTVIMKEAFLGDSREEVPSSAKIQYDIDIKIIAETLVKGDNVWVSRDQLVKSKLTLLKEVMR